MKLAPGGGSRVTDKQRAALESYVSRFKTMPQPREIKIGFSVHLTLVQAKRDLSSLVRRSGESINIFIVHKKVDNGKYKVKVDITSGA